MKNLGKYQYIRIGKLYVIISFIITAITCSWTNQVLANTSKAESTTYPGLVKSSLVQNNLIQPDGKVVKPLLDFLDLFGISHDGTVKSVNAAMQKHFLRKAGVERMDLADTEQDKALRPKALDLLKAMGLVDSIRPTKTIEADYFLVFGGTLPTIQKRLDDLLNQYKAGRMFCKSVVFLGGVRETTQHELLHSLKQELKASFTKFIKGLKKEEKELTETDLFRFLWQTRTDGTLKTLFQESKKNLFFITSDITGTNKRATTKDTINTWLEKYKPVPGSCHGNTEKPYGIRMEKALRLALEKYTRTLTHPTKAFSITWNSPAAASNVLLSIYKDELARTFHTEIQLKEYLTKEYLTTVD